MARLVAITQYLVRFFHNLLSVATGDEIIASDVKT